MTTIEEVMPDYHFRERHSRIIDASPDSVWDALTSVTLNDLAVTRVLAAVRGMKGPRSRGLFDNSGPVRMFETVAPLYVIGGNVARPWQPRPSKADVSSIEEFSGFTEPGWVKYLADFRVRPVDGGVEVSTETRGYSTDPRSRRLFACYWAVIRPWSGLIRRDMLAAVARLSATR
jgi:hypothetical protein